MSGIAITIPNANFYSEFGNTITDLVDVPVTGITIITTDYLVGTKYALAVQYTPLKTSNRGVKWEITSGSEYAAVDPATGVLTIFEGANMKEITVKATSLYTNAVTDSKTISVMYKRSADAVGSTLGNLKNVNADADAYFNTRKTLVKLAGAREWTLDEAPPTIVTNLTEDEVVMMIENGTVDENTLYFCEE